MPFGRQGTVITGRPPYWDNPRVDGTGRKDAIVRYANERLMEWWSFMNSTPGHEALMYSDAENFDGGVNTVPFGWVFFGGGPTAGRGTAPEGAPCNAVFVRGSNTEGIHLQEEGCHFKVGEWYSMTFFVKCDIGVGRVCVGTTDFADTFTEIVGRDYAASNTSNWQIVPGNLRELPFTFRIEPGSAVPNKVQVRIKGTTAGTQDKIQVADVCVQEGRFPAPSIRRDCCPRPPVECYPGVPVTGLTDVPSTFPSQPAGVGSPNTKENGVFEVDRFDVDKVTGLSGSIPIPEDLKHSTWGLTVDVNVIPPTGDGILDAEYEVQLDYAAVDRGGDPSPVALTESLSKTVTCTDTDSLNRILFFISHANLTTKEGGKVGFAFYRRGDLEGGNFVIDSLDVVSINTFFGPEVTDPVIP